MTNRVERVLTDEDMARVAGTVHAWRGDVPGFCYSAKLDEIEKNSFVLTPGRYVATANQEEDDEPFEQKMTHLVAQLRQQQSEGARLDAAIANNLDRLDFGKP